jgi:diguanylate cyclase (GGDEF)-like protein
VDAPDDASHGEAVAHKETVYSTAVPRGFRSLRFNKRGELLGAHAPIVGGDGELLGLVGVEIDGSSLYGHLRRLNRTLLLTYALILALALASVLEFSNAVIDRLFKDKLTGAYTKRYFDGLLHDEVARCARHGQGLALLMLDLDHYKSLNDEHGHAFGDRVLAAASEAMWRSVRPSDYLVRYGGDEFAIIMADAGAGAALAAAERIRRAVEETRVFDDERVEQVGVTISIGVAELGHLAQGAQDLVKNADRALYHAKAARNAVMVFQ